MMAQIVAEWRKVFSTRMWWVLLAVLFGYAAFMSATVGLAFHFGAQSSPEMKLMLGHIGLARTVYAFGLFVAPVFGLLIGAMTVTQEFRHKTISNTLWVNPNRGQVLLAKAVVCLPVGLLFGLVAVVGSVAPAGLLLVGFGGDAGLTQGDTWAMLARAVLAMAIWAVVGVGWGALVPNQVAVIVVMLAITQFVEPMLRLLPSLLGHPVPVLDYLPSAAAGSLTGADIYSMMTAVGGGGPGGLPAWAGALVLLAWAVVPGLIGYRTTFRRDVT